MKTRLFDTSAIILLIKKHPDEASVELDGEHILDLTFYEVGNALWKISKLLDKTGASKALQYIEEAYSILSLMEVQKLEGAEDLSQTMEIAHEKNLSFYDAAYIHVARRMGCTLVTEDKRLQKASEELRVKTSRI
jgi:predicted nucleic acid-binding protein